MNSSSSSRDELVAINVFISILCRWWLTKSATLARSIIELMSLLHSMMVRRRFFPEIQHRIVSAYNLIDYNHVQIDNLCREFQDR